MVAILKETCKLKVIRNGTDKTQIVCKPEESICHKERNKGQLDYECILAVK